jgi:hypothetical protein
MGHLVMPLSTLVIGCSEQLPNEPLAYRFMGTSSQGVVLLSRHGATYSATTGEVCAYRELVERLLGLALQSCPPGRRERARGALIRRWNRDWGVEVEEVGDPDEVPVERVSTGAVC